MMIGDPQNKLLYDSEEGILRFDVIEFTKLFIYHVLYHFIAGPFASLIIAPIESCNFVRNLKFTEFCHRAGWIQLLPWIIHGYVLFVMMTNEEEIISSVVIPVAILWYILRISIICTRYATATPSET